MELNKRTVYKTESKRPEIGGPWAACFISRKHQDSSNVDHILGGQAHLRGVAVLALLSMWGL